MAWESAEERRRKHHSRTRSRRLINDDPPAQPRCSVTFQRIPRVFMSYRHREFADGPDAEARNRRHVAFVEQLAADLRNWGVEVVYDGRIRRMVQPLLTTPAEQVPIVADLTVASIAVCHAFMPILTPGYIERLGFAGYEQQSSAEDGYVLEEWQIGMTQVVNGKQDYIPVVRAGDIAAYQRLPLGVAGRAFDLRDGVDYEDTVERIADTLHLGWTVEKPPLDMSLKSWLEEFIRERLEMDKRRSR
jgi:hypothetical protein